MDGERYTPRPYPDRRFDVLLPISDPNRSLSIICSLPEVNVPRDFAGLSMRLSIRSTRSAMRLATFSSRPIQLSVAIFDKPVKRYRGAERDALLKRRARGDKTSAVPSMSEDEPWISPEEIEARIRRDPVALRGLLDDEERAHGRVADQFIRAIELAERAKRLLDAGDHRACRKCLDEIVAISQEEPPDDKGWVGYGPIDT
jgi:hypothetical protein